MADDEIKTEDLGQFKTTEDLLKSYKEIQGAFTAVSQENKSLKESANPEEMQKLQTELATAKEELELSLARPAPVAKGQDKSFDESWMESPEGTIDERVAYQVGLARIADVFDDENEKNPAEFQERVSYVNHLANDPKFVHLKQTPAGTRRLFKEADKLRSGNLEKSGKKYLEFLNDGEPLDDEQMANAKKILFGKKKTNKSNNDAYMPDGSTSTKSVSDDDQVKIDKAKMTEAAEKGDVDGVLDAMFNDILA
jgi:hypothetical protein